MNFCTALQKLRVTIVPALLASAGFTCSSAVNAAGTITIDPQVTHQTMAGWETTGRLWQFDKAGNRFNPQWERYAAQIFEKLVNDVGINRFRLEALSGIENPVDYWSKFTNNEIGYSEFREHFYEKINDDTNPQSANSTNFQFGYMDYIVEKMLLPIKQKVEANGEKLYINLNYVDFKWTNLRGNFEHAQSPDEYAEFVLACFNHLKTKYGIVPDAFELILEADNTLHWTGTNIGQGLLAVQKRLSAAGYNPEYIAPSTAQAAQAIPYFNQLIAVGGVSEILTTLAYHRYDASVSPRLLTDIATTAANWNLSTGMLEHVGGNATELFEDLTIGQASSWQQYGIATNLEDNNGGYYLKVNLDNPDNPDIYLDFRAAQLSMVFRYVRQGAKRLSTKSDLSGVIPAAFKNTDNTNVLTMHALVDSEADIVGLPGGNYRITHAAANGTITTEGVLNHNDGDNFTMQLKTGFTTIADTRLPAPSSVSNNAAAQNPLSFGAGNENSGDSGSGSLTFSMIILLLLACFRQKTLRKFKRALPEKPE